MRSFPISLAIGDRVVAVRSIGEGELHIYGKGIYEGEFRLAKEDTLGMSGVIRRNDDLPVAPRVLLDSGERVWGFLECQILPENLLSKAADGKNVVEVSIQQDRDEIKEKVSEFEGMIRIARESALKLDPTGEILGVTEHSIPTVLQDGTVVAVIALFVGVGPDGKLVTKKLTEMLAQNNSSDFAKLMAMPTSGRPN
jgi:hypothetical protein